MIWLLFILSWMGWFGYLLSGGAGVARTPLSSKALISKIVSPSDQTLPSIAFE
jgi:hypothetical protein